MGEKRPWALCSDTEYLYSSGEARFDSRSTSGDSSYQHTAYFTRKPNGDADVEMISIEEDSPPFICQQEACVSPVYQDSGWVVWTADGPRDTNKLCSFLQLFKPSISRAGVKWISVNTTSPCHASSRLDRPRAHETQEEALRSILKKPAECLTAEVKAEVGIYFCSVLFSFLLLAVYSPLPSWNSALASLSHVPPSSSVPEATSRLSCQYVWQLARSLQTQRYRQSVDRDSHRCSSGAAGPRCHGICFRRRHRRAHNTRVRR